MDWNRKQVDQTQDEPNQSIYTQSERKNFVWIPRIASLFVAYTLSKYCRPPSDWQNSFKVLQKHHTNSTWIDHTTEKTSDFQVDFPAIFQSPESGFREFGHHKNPQKIFSKRKSIFQPEISRNLFCYQNSWFDTTVKKCTDIQIFGRGSCPTSFLNSNDGREKRYAWQRLEH